MVFVAALYFPTLGFGLTYDDALIVADDRALAEFSPRDLVRVSGRVVRTASLWLDRALFGEPPGGYHLQNLLWHAGAVLLLFAYVRRTTRSDLIAYATAVFFAALPVHVEAVANISNRKELLCLFFSLAALLSYDRFLTARSTPRLIGTAVLGYLAIQSKEVAAMLPLAFLLHERFFVTEEDRWLTKRASVQFAIVAVFLAAAAWFARQSVPGDDLLRIKNLAGFEGEVSWAKLIYTSGKAFCMYLSMLVLPTDLTPDHTVRLEESLVNAGTLAGFGILAALLGIAIALRRHAPLSFGIAWFLVWYLPLSNWIPSSYIVAERYLYVPSVGFCLAIGWLASTGFRTGGLSRGLAAVGFLGVVGFATLQTATYQHAWRDDETLWSYVYDRDPGSAKAATALGQLAAKRNDPSRADAYYREAIAANPNYTPAWYDLGNSLFARRAFDDAIEAYTKAIELMPGFAAAYVNRATAHVQQQRYDAALEDFGHAIRIQPELAEARLNRGLLLLGLKRFEEAAADLEIAVRALPGNANARAKLEEARSKINPSAGS